MPAWKLLPVVAAFLLAGGTGWLVLLGYRWRCGPEWLGLALAAGAAWLAVVVAALAPFPGAAVPAVLLPLLAAPAAILFLRRPAGARAALGRGWTGFAPALVVALLSFWLAAQRPVWNVDAQKRWVLHAQWQAHEATVLPDAVRDPEWAFAHPSYPPLVPAVAGLALGLGADRDLGLRPLFPLFFLALLGVLFGHARRSGEERRAPWVALGFALTPCFGWLARHDAALGLGADAAMADVPAALYCGALGALIVQGLATGERAAWRLAAVLAAGAALVKQEAMMLAAAMLAVTALYVLFRPARRRGVLPALLLPVLVFLAAAGGWRLLASGFPVEAGEDYLGVGLLPALAANLDRLPGILVRLAAEHFRFPVWGLLWVLAAGALLAVLWAWARRGSWRTDPPLRLLVAWWIAATALIAGAYLATGWKDGSWETLMEFSLTRLLMHHAPIVALMMVHFRLRRQAAAGRPG